MKFILISAIFVIAVTSVTYFVSGQRFVQHPDQALLIPHGSPTDMSIGESQETTSSPVQATAPYEKGDEAAAVARIIVGELMDPNDELTLPPRTERISVGEPMDPNDESTLPLRTERISIGDPMDPNDESTLPLRTERISIGEPMDPNDETTLPQRTERISVGEQMDVD